MESAWPILLFLGFLFGAMVLILSMGIRWREWEEEDSEPEPERPVVRVPQLGGSRFFGSVEAHPLLGPVAMQDDAPAGEFERRLESYIQSECETAADFAASPSVEDLFRPSGFVGFETPTRDA